MTNPPAIETLPNAGIREKGRLSETRVRVGFNLSRCFMLAACSMVAATGSSQTIYTPSSGFPSAQSGVGSAPVDSPITNLTPVAPTPTYAPPPSSYGSFDPYASTPGGSSFSTPPPTAPAAFGAPVNNPPIFGPSTYTAPPAGTTFAPPPAFPSSVYPQSSPSSLYPDGMGTTSMGTFLTNPAAPYNPIKFMQGPRFRYAFVSPGDEPENLGINDFDFSLAFACPRLLNSTQPFFVVPSFSLHLWDGPDGSIGADLPPNAYSAFVDLGWQSDPNQMCGTEIGLRPGIFTDFDTYSGDSWRISGKALATFRTTPTTVLKGGLYYADRNEIKLVPAFGIFCRPDPFTQIDLYFPAPRYAKFCSTIGVYDLWWYLTTDLGGGSWTITRDEGYEDSVDINDYRAILGFEWGPTGFAQKGRRTAFAEIGYVFEREVVYRYSPQDNYNPDDGLMFRVGIGY